jgi:hypothetical protein
MGLGISRVSIGNYIVRINGFDQTTPNVGRGCPFSYGPTQSNAPSLKKRVNRNIRDDIRRTTAGGTDVLDRTTEFRKGNY